MSLTRCRAEALVPVVALVSLLAAAQVRAQSSGSPPPDYPMPPDLQTSPGPGLQPGPEAGGPDVPPAPVPPDPGGTPTPPIEDPNALLDGHPRSGPFLAGPGSMVFILHHTLMASTGGLVTQGIAHRFSLESGSREAMLIGTLVGAGLGFGVSAWWQFNHWIDYPAANFGVVNSLFTGMFFTGLVDMFSNDSTTLAYSALIGMELGAWLSILVGGGELKSSTGLAVASGGAWAAAYTALLMATLANSGSSFNRETWVDTLMIAPGLGAGALALAGLRFAPTATQVLRADAFGAGVGGVVLLLSALVLGGFGSPTPYALALLTSAGAIAAVSIFWEEAAEHPGRALYRSPEKDRPYSTVWW